AEHLVVIGRGKLLADTSMADFIRDNSRTYVRLRSPERERLLDVLRQEGVPVTEGADGTLEADHADPARLGELAHRHGLVLHELSPQSASLEDAFMQLTAQTVEYHAHTGAGPAVVPPGTEPPPAP
ncbi:ABC transporter ATP-binding protein, partial [Streptomyces sp. SID11233]|nr:ABC transporter ATP-binding protein [Streptomyces sp. SID11233]